MNNFGHKENRETLRNAIYSSRGGDCHEAQSIFDLPSAKRWGRAYRWYLRGWLPEQKNATISDLGCGNGRLLYFFKEQGYTNLVGVDISPDQVVLAQQVVSNVVQMSALDWLTDKRRQLDLIVSLDFIEHLYRDEVLNFLDLCHASLKPGGRLILQTPNADSPFGIAVRYGDITHECIYNANQLVRLLRRAGFADIEYREQSPVPIGYSLSSTFRWIIWLMIRSGLQLWNLAETGARLPVLTRVFLISGTIR